MYLCAPDTLLRFLEVVEILHYRSRRGAPKAQAETSCSKVRSHVLDFAEGTLAAVPEGKRRSLLGFFTSNLQCRQSVPAPTPLQTVLLVPARVMRLRDMLSLQRSVSSRSVVSLAGRSFNRCLPQGRVKHV